MSELLERAFAALGTAPSWRELELVTQTLRAAGDEEALTADREQVFAALAELARAAGSSGFVALDLATEVANPGGAQRAPSRRVSAHRFDSGRRLSRSPC
ncbi:MAG: hypothetical protein ACXWG2_12790 [Solirubrobacterales bacterium]